jgi:hypothetical protein
MKQPRSVRGRGPRRRFGLVPGLLLGIGLAACSDSAGPAESPIRLSATMKLAADSLVVTLRVQNVSDTTQVLEWNGGCLGDHPADFALYRDAGLTQQVWKQPTPSTCSVELGEMTLAPRQSGTIRGFPVATAQMLAVAGTGGRYFVAVHPHSLTVRPRAGSYDMPVDAKVPVGAVDLGPAVSEF